VLSYSSKANDNEIKLQQLHNTPKHTTSWVHHSFILMLKFKPTFKPNTLINCIINMCELNISNKHLSLSTTARILINFFIISLVVSINVNAQSDWIGAHNLMHFSKTDYKGGTQNHDIIQSSEGFIYVANNNGVLEYDGIHWVLHPLPNKTIARSLTASKDGKLFVGGQNELGYFTMDQSGDWVWNDIIPKMPENEQVFSDVWHMEGKDNLIYIGTSNKLFVWTGENIQLVHKSDQICHVFKCGGDVCLQDGKAIYIVKGSILEPWLELPNPDLITKGLIRRGTQIVLATEKNGLYFLSDGNWAKSITRLNYYLEQNSINTILQTSRATYIGTARGGLLTLDNRLEDGFTYSIENGLNNNNVLSIFEDSDENVWIGLDNGIDLILQSSPFSNVHPDAPLNGAGYAAIVFEDQLFLGSSNGLYQQKQKNPDFQFKPTEFGLIPGTQGQVYSIQEIRGKLLVGHHDGAYQIEKGYAQILSREQGVWTFHQLKQNPDLMVAGTYSGLLLFEWGQEGWEFKEKIEGIDESCRIITEDADGYLWVSHPYRGAYRIDIDQKYGEILDVSLYKSEQGFPTDLHIYVSQIGNELIFTSDKGLYTYSSELDSIIPFNAFNEYLGDSKQIQRIFEDNSGNIWYVSEDETGVLKVSETSLDKSVAVFRIPELQGKFVAGFESMYFTEKNEAYIGSDKGFLHLNTSDLLNRKFIPPSTFIRSVKLNSRDSIIYSPYGAPAEQQVNLGKFTPENASFTFSFGSTRFAELSQITYSFWLEGFEKNWTTNVTSWQKEYTNLEPGNYTFHVKAAISDTAEGAEQTISFSVLPPWYSSLWGLIVLFIILIIILLSLIWLPRRKYVKELAKKENVLITERQRSEEELTKLQKINLEKEVEFQNKELASATMHLVQKGKILQDIKDALTKIQAEKSGTPEKEIHGLIRAIDEDVRLDQNWEQFERHFDRVHVDFLQRVRDQFPQLTPNDHKLCAYLRMNLSTKEIATVLNISVRGVEISRYRLRKKLDLESEDNLTEFILAI
jgi:ligand-binding sensor domain-containing protein/DNA-binding CsgD family transcriptional regulator